MVQRLIGVHPKATAPSSDTESERLIEREKVTVDKAYGKSCLCSKQVEPCYESERIHQQPVAHMQRDNLP